MDISTVVLGLLGTAVGGFIPEGEEFMTNFAFYCLIGMVAYSVAETAKGRVANQVSNLYCRESLVFLTIQDRMRF